jgi:murein DD-endopeptidase MepM/ murein hydrolase activator NlpD
MENRSTRSDFRHTLFFRSVSLVGSLGLLSGGLVWAQTQPAEGMKQPLGPESAPIEDAPDLKGVPIESVFEAPVEAPAESLPPEPDFPSVGDIPDSAPAEALSDPSYTPESGGEAAEYADEAPAHEYIDPTDYSLGATEPDEKAPAEVIFTERSTGCESVVGSGGISGACGDAEAAEPSSAAKAPLAPEAIPTENPAIGLPGFLVPQATPQTLPQAETETAQDTTEPSAETAEAEAVAEGTSATGQAGMEYATDIPLIIDDPSDALLGLGFPATNIPAVAMNMIPIGPNGFMPNFSVDSSAIYYQYLGMDSSELRARGPRPLGVIGNGNSGLIFPLTVPAPITSAFGWRIHPVSGTQRLHTGTDMGAPLGTPVVAALAGKVAIADFMGGYGLAAILRHNNDTQETLYGHMSELFVKPGDTVQQGEVIGLVGSTGVSTGPHLHFELRQQTEKGWAYLNPGRQLEFALAQLANNFQTANVEPANNGLVNNEPTNNPGE